MSPLEPVEVAALGHHQHAVPGGEPPRLPERRGPVGCGRLPGQHGELRQVGRHDVDPGQQVAHRALGGRVEEAVAARGHHDGVEDDGGPGHDRRARQGVEPGGHGLGHGGRRQHPDLHRVDGDVVHQGVELVDEECGGRHVHVAHAPGVLHGQRREGGHPVAPRRGDRLEVRLDPRAARRVGARDRQDAGPRGRPSRPRRGGSRRDSRGSRGGGGGAGVAGGAVFRCARTHVDIPSLVRARSGSTGVVSAPRAPAGSRTRPTTGRTPCRAAHRSPAAHARGGMSRAVSARSADARGRLRAGPR